MENKPHPGLIAAVVSRRIPNRERSKRFISEEQSVDERERFEYFRDIF